MSNYPDKMPTLIPYLTVAHAKNSIRFYEKAFGFEWLNSKELDMDGNIEHVEMRFKDVIIMFASEGAFGSSVKTPAHLGESPATSLYLYCDDVDAIYKRSTENGATSLFKPNDSFWGDRFCKVTDPDGNEWMFAKALNQACN